MGNYWEMGIGRGGHERFSLNLDTSWSKSVFIILQLKLVRNMTYSCLVKESLKRRLKQLADLKWRKMDAQLGLQLEKLSRAGLQNFPILTFGAWNCLSPSSETCKKGDVLGKERILPRAPLVFWGVSKVAMEVCWVRSHCFVLGLLPEYYFYFRSKKKAKAH